MKEAILIYQGFKKDRYCFLTAEGKEFSFQKAQNGLVRDFRLQSDWSIGKKFLARYFVSIGNINDTFILSDLERIE